MTRRLVATVVAVVLSRTVYAHHSIASAYDAAQPVTVEGIVSSDHFVNPHPYIEIDAPDAGRTERWRLELDNRNELTAVGMSAATLKAGDRLVVTGSRGRKDPRNVYVRSLQRPADGFLYEQVGASPRVRLPQR